jgi:hypothetical protein
MGAVAFTLVGIALMSIVFRLIERDNAENTPKPENDYYRSVYGIGKDKEMK